MATVQARSKVWSVVLWASRVGLCALFMAAAVPKLLDPAAFAQDISNYRIVPPALVGALALALPPLEAAAGLALLTRPYFRGGALLVGAMLTVFAVAMAQAKLRGIDLACGCFGREVADPVSWTKVAFDLGLAILAGWVAWTERPSSLPQAAP